METKSDTRFKVLVFDEKNFILKLNDMTAEAYAETHARILGFPEKKYKFKLDAFLVPQTASNMKYLRQRFATWEYEIEQDAVEVMKVQDLTETQQELKSKRRWEYIFEDQVPALPIIDELKTVPFKQQVVGLDALHQSEFFGLLMEMGTGKTKICIDEICWTGKGKFLVVCPKSVQQSWVDEFETHAWKPYHLTKLKRNFKGVEGLVKGLRADEDIKVWVINYEGVAGLLDPLLRMEFDMVILDESTYIKNRKAKRTKAIQYLGSTATRRVILNGTPAPNNILDLYSQFEFLKPGVLGYTNYNQFRKYYAQFKKSKGGFEKLVGYQNLEQLKMRMATCSFFVKKKQCLDLPEKQFVTRKLDMTDKQEEMYQMMLEICLADLEGNMSPEGTVSASVIIVQLLRLSQIACGFLRTTDGNTRNIPGGNPKLEALRDILETTDGKVIVWARFKQDVENIVSMIQLDLNEGCVCITGAENEQMRDQAKRSFNSDDGARVLVGNPATGGLGLTLLGGDNLRCTTVVYYSNDFSCYKRLQSEDRTHRIGLRNPVTYYDLVCQGTVEERILNVLQDKKELNEVIANYKELKGFLLGSRKGDKMNILKTKKKEISQDLFDLMNNKDAWDQEL